MHEHDAALGRERARAGDERVELGSDVAHALRHRRLASLMLEGRADDGALVVGEERQVVRSRHVALRKLAGRAHVDRGHALVEHAAKEALHV